MNSKFLLAAALVLTLFRANAQKFTVPQKAQFDKAETLKMVTAGKSIIKGRVYAKDNKAGLLKGMAVMNINPKQYAPVGTQVVLVPYTDYFKEYHEVSQKYAKQGKVVELPQEAAECIKVTYITDGEGNYSFSNLTPGKFLLFTRFGYVHEYTVTQTVGRSDLYVGGIYQGSSPITNRYSQGEGADAVIEKIVTIEEDGQVKEVNLKKTR